MRQNNYIPQQGGINPAQIMMRFQQFKKDYYEQNGPNADPKAAFMQYVQDNNIDNATVQRAQQLASMLGFK